MMKYVLENIVIGMFVLFSFASNADAGSNRSLLLTQGAQPLRVSENDFLLLSRYYTVITDLRDPLTAVPDSTLFQDGNGAKYPCAVISDYELEGIDTLRLQVFQRYVEDGGILLVFDVSDSPAQRKHFALQRLTGGRIQGAEYRFQPSRVSIFTSSVPQLTDVFTGLTLDSHAEQYTKYDQALNIVSDTTIIPIMSSLDSLGKTFPMFVSCSLGAGTIYASSTNQWRTISNLMKYYSPTAAPELLPSMMVLKMIYGSQS